VLLSEGQLFHVHHGDCIPRMAHDAGGVIDFTVFSPPFPALYAYTSEACDIGNSEDFRTEAKLHLSWFYRVLARVLKPGRVALVHVMQIPKLKRTGEAGTFDFRGLNIRIAQRCGLIYNYDWLVTKNPQTEAIRSRSHALQFASMTRDRAVMHGQLGDYLIKFRAPGENKVPIDSPDQVSRAEWIAWAESAWPWRGEHAIQQSRTLNTTTAKADGDTKHICPLQLDIIDRAVRLYSNPGEIVFSPFAGIGSEGYEAIRLGRRFYGCELKNEYHAEALRNLERTAREFAGAGQSSQLSIFDLPAAEEEGAVAL
jgi:hypothetical protein